jgi:hypothetical protein
VLRALGARLGADGEVIVVPGNHDIALVRPWVRERAVALEADTPVPLDATPVLSRLTSLLRPARVSVHYPGAWLSERVWATHGHYLDRHLVPESAFGVARGLLGRPPRERAAPIEYELARVPSLTRLEAVLTRTLPRPLAMLVEDLAELGRAATMPRAARRLLHRRLAPITSTVLGVQMQRAGIPALVRVVRRLGVDAGWVVFGHLHRLGPLPDDRPPQWQGTGGGPAVVNTGSWVYEPLLVHSVTPPHPYWPGGAVVLSGESEPQAVGLLDDLDAPALRPTDAAGRRLIGVARRRLIDAAGMR